LRLLSLLPGLVGLVLGILGAGVGLIGFVLRLLGLLGGLVGRIRSLRRGLVGLAGLVLCLPGSILRLLRVSPGLLGLLARSLGLLPDHVDPVPDPIHLLADVLSGRQLPQRTSVLIPTLISTGVLALAALLTCCLCHFTLLAPVASLQ
jgi:hypothetical protein